MIEEIKKHIAAVEEFTTNQVSEVEEFRIKYLGKKGILKQFFAEFKNVANEQKKEFGMTINKLQNLATQKVNDLKADLQNSVVAEKKYGDLTRPGITSEVGSRHPISIVKNQNR